MRRGRLILVVGPSGVGKDSVIDGARLALRDRSDVTFPRRYITRPAGLGGEDYISVTEAEFVAMAKRGDFALSWAAHGLRYGVPGSIAADVAAGRQVVANVSRAVIAEARRQFPGLLVVLITASPAILRARLERRGRESPAEIADRLARAAAFTLSGDDVAVLNNDGALSDTIARFVDLLEQQAVS